MKKELLAMMAVGMLMTGCGTSAVDTPTETADTTQIANPFTEYATLEEAEEAAGFELSVPEIEGYSNITYRVMDSDTKMIEVIYSEGEDEIRVRKQNTDGDISGDYNEYDTTSTMTVNDAEVTVKGNGEGVSVATWSVGEYSYSVTASDGTFYTVDTMAHFIENIQ